MAKEEKGKYVKIQSSPIPMICKEHGIIDMTAREWAIMRGHFCPLCYAEEVEEE